MRGWLAARLGIMYLCIYLGAGYAWVGVSGPSPSETE